MENIHRIEKPNFEIVKDMGLRSFLEYVWKRLEREDAAIQSLSEEISVRKHIIKYAMWANTLEIFMSGVKGEVPFAFRKLYNDFAEHNSDPSGSDGPFVRRITVGA